MKKFLSLALSLTLIGIIYLAGKPAVAPGPPIKVTGTIGQGVECPYALNGCTGGSWIIDLPSGYNVGDVVTITGRESNPISICMQPFLGILSIRSGSCN